ncbi:MAG TPA: ATP-binding protein [Ktedonosporobacter sp.]|nr:ATP-binding protein [Ktedonosporobacter sp.]
MRRRISNWWSSLLGMGRFSREAGAAMFQGLRIRLTLWYCGVLALALVLFGVALYIGVQAALFGPVEGAADMHAHHLADVWGQIGPDNMCIHPRPGPPPSGLGSMPETVVCFDQNGLLINQDTTVYPTAVLATDLVAKVLQDGQPQSTIVDGAKGVGRIYLYAFPVRNSLETGPVAGVVVVGEFLRPQDSVLSLLLMLLLPVGSIALVGAGLGGLFLAQRALAPARLAWERQQRFIGDASHELRTPLTLLRADAEVLLRSRKRVGPDDAALLEDMVAETNHMANLLNNMLTLARLDNRAEHQEYEVVKLSEVAQAGVRRIQALAGQMEITVEIEANESSVVIGDSAQLEQAVLALLDNAIKYNHRGGHVTLRTAMKGKQALLEVSDTGIGIAAEHLSHLGERFYRVDKARSREAGGTGLGLSIVRGIAVAHGGSLTLKSVPEQGTTATITLPLAQSALSAHGHDAPSGNVPLLPQSML